MPFMGQAKPLSISNELARADLEKRLMICMFVPFHFSLLSGICCLNWLGGHFAITHIGNNQFIHHPCTHVVEQMTMDCPFTQFISG